MDKKDENSFDENQYSLENIDHYETIFGKQYVSTGGAQTIGGFAELLQLKEGEHVLDFGSGLGGSAFYLASNFKVTVLGVDVSKNMIDKANSYLNSAEDQIRQNVKFELRGVTDKGFPEEYFDCIFTRETIVHIHDKLGLFKSFQKCLKKGGRLLISDYCLGPDPSSEEFQDYIKSRNYKMIPLSEYQDLLQNAGFSHVQLTDLTPTCINILENDVKRLEFMRQELLLKMSLEKFEGMINGWKRKLQRCQNGNQGWGLILARK